MAIVFRYAIGTDLCEESFIIIAGDGHCFDIRGHTVCSFFKSQMTICDEKCHQSICKLFDIY